MTALKNRPYLIESITLEVTELGLWRFLGTFEKSCFKANSLKFL